MPKRVSHDEVFHACLLLEENGLMAKLPQQTQDALELAKHRSMVNGFAEVSDAIAEICELAADVAAGGSPRDVAMFLQRAQAQLA